MLTKHFMRQATFKLIAQWCATPDSKGNRVQLENLSKHKDTIIATFGQKKYAVLEKICGYNEKITSLQEAIKHCEEQRLILPTFVPEYSTLTKELAECKLQLQQQKIAQHGLLPPLPYEIPSLKSQAKKTIWQASLLSNEACVKETLPEELIQYLNQEEAIKLNRTDKWDDFFDGFIHACGRTLEAVSDEQGLSKHLLMFAAELGQNGLLEELFKQGVSLNVVEEGILYRLLLDGTPTSETINYLLAHGANPNKGVRETALNLALLSNKMEIVHLLIDHGADLNQVGRGLPLPTYVKSESHTPDFILIQKMLAKGAKFSSEDKNLLETQGKINSVLQKKFFDLARTAPELDTTLQTLQERIDLLQSALANQEQQCLKLLITNRQLQASQDEVPVFLPTPLQPTITDPLANSDSLPSVSSLSFTLNSIKNACQQIKFIEGKKEEEVQLGQKVVQLQKKHDYLTEFFSQLIEQNAQLVQLLLYQKKQLEASKPSSKESHQEQFEVSLSQGGFFNSSDNKRKLEQEPSVKLSSKKPHLS